MSDAHGSGPRIPGDGPQSVAAILDRPAQDVPDTPALIGRHGRFTYAELDREVRRACRALQALGLGAGDRIAACLPNDVDVVIAFLASQRLGAVWVGVNKPLASPEKGYLLSDSGARAALVTADVREELAASREELGGLEHIVAVAPGREADEWRVLVAAQSDAPLALPAVDPFDPAAIAYTSGTTGFPKGAVHSQHNLLLPGAVSRLTAQARAPQNLGVVLPLTILNLMILAPVAVFQDQRCCICMDRIDPLGLADWVKRESVHTFTAVPTVFHDLLTHPDVDPADLESLQVPGMGGTDVPPELVELFGKRFGRGVTIGYGMTEAPTAVAWSSGEVPRGPGLCGRPVPQVEIEIVDEQGDALGRGEEGEICVRPARSGPFAGVYTPMLGYWNKPEATASALRGDRYHTGDVGVIEDDGNLYIRGRRNELILRGGANVYPAEVERVLRENAGVADAAVFGVPDVRLGERVVAVVQPAADAPLDDDALLRHARAHLARYKVPSAIAVVDALPRNAMNKVIKSKLKHLFES